MSVRRPLPLWGIVTILFALGWLLGFAVVAKASSLVGASAMLGGPGYVAFMLAPLATAFLVTRFAGQLLSRAWGLIPTQMAVLGVVGAVAGFLSL